MLPTHRLLTRLFVPVAVVMGCWLTPWGTGPAHAADNEPPVDVPITRGKIEMDSIRPTLGPMAKPNPADAAASTATPAAGAAPSTSATSTTALGETINNPPRTVADFAAMAKAKAAAEAANKSSAPAPSATTATATAATTATLPAPASTPAAAPATATVAPAPDQAAPAPKTAATRKPDRAATSANAAADNGMQTLAEKIVEAMARADGKQAAREKPAKPSPKKDTASASAGTTPPSTASRDDIRAKAAALAAQVQAEEASEEGEHEVFLGNGHWSYEGHTGPANWAKLNPDFGQCARGKRQSPIAIDSSTTLQGPAEAIDFRYEPVAGSVLNNGHTIQVDLAPGNFLTVRGTRYELLQFHFHHPAEEQINGTTHPMVAHLVHRSAEGELAVLAVPLASGAANPVVGTVWTHMPLDKDDRVPLPSPGLNLLGLLPRDQRYFQYMGSLTTPPCSEGVLWLVLKTPVTLSPAQLTLFGQLFPNNARPVQPTQERPVREAM